MNTSQIARAFIRSPILWGLLATLAFFAPFELGLIRSQFEQRYFAGHPVNYTETAMFFIGLAFLTLRWLDLAGQRAGLGARLLPPAPTGGHRIDQCEELLSRVERIPASGSYLVARLRDGLEYVHRRGTTEGLDEQLKFLADQDAARMHAEYGLMRLVIWAIPILGFLGTVIGITIAIANLAPDALEKSLPQVTAGLGVAFDTTALALGLSMVLMFIQFYVDRAENALLGEVDRRVERELIGRFASAPARGEGQTLAMHQLAEQLLAATEQLVQRQAEIWQTSMDAAAGRWAGMSREASSQIHDALEKSLMAHAQRLAAAEQAAAERNRQQWTGVERGLVQASEAIRAAQATLVEKAEVLGRTVDATQEIQRLEEGLNRNLAALAGSKNFEQTVMSLAAAIHLLNARLAPVTSDTPVVQLEPRKRTGQAA